jgi:hypothetical protein
MGNSLTNLNIQDTYFGLIKTNGCNEQIQSTRTILSDGNGNDSSLSIATANNGICVTGNSIFNCNVAMNNLQICGNNICDSSAARISIGNTTCILGNLQLNLDNIKDATGVDRIRTCSNKVTTCGNLCVNGCIEASDDIIAFNSSDINLKDNLKQIESNTFFNNLTGYSFDWNEKSDREGKSYGFIAQDLEKIAPELVKTNTNNYKAINYIELLPVMFEEIKVLKSRVEELEKAN